MRRATLIVMIKEPRPGRVKTRLGRDIGMTAAAWWFRHQVASLLRRIADPRWDVVLAVAPDRAGIASRVWPGHLRRVPQGGGDLGTRMARQFRRASPRPVLIVGGDIPDIDRRRIARAFAALRCHDAVIGPAADGGYWAIGLSRGGRVPSGLFDGVRWSTPDAMADTLATVPRLRVALTDRLRDVDDAADLAALRRIAR